jgi:hypothetical protein
MDIVARFERIVCTPKEVVETVNGNVVWETLHPLDAAEELDSTHFLIEGAVPLGSVFGVDVEPDVEAHRFTLPWCRLPI